MSRRRERTASLPFLLLSQRVARHVILIPAKNLNDSKQSAHLQRRVEMFRGGENAVLRPTRTGGCLFQSRLKPTADEPASAGFVQQPSVRMKPALNMTRLQACHSDPGEESQRQQAPQKQGPPTRAALQFRCRYRQLAVPVHPGLHAAVQEQYVGLHAVQPAGRIGCRVR